MSDHDRRIAGMFDRVAPRYDRLNRVLSLGTDVGWRRRTVFRARLGPGEIGVDIGVGTGDLAGGVLRASDEAARVIGVDLSPRMLAISRRRLRRTGLEGRYAAVIASAEALPLPDTSADVVVSGFTLRNIGDLPRGLAEMRRVLRPRGRAVLLELSHPPNALIRFGYRLYFEGIAPRVAALLGGDPEAYRYLPRSLRPFPTAERLSALISEAGFENVRFDRMFLGVAAIHIGTVPDANVPASATEIIVVLGSKRSQVQRAKAAAALARERGGAVVIVSGRAGFEPPRRPTEARVMADVLRREGVSPARIFLEDESRDTVGNAVFTARRYLRGIAPRPLTVVTSPFHLERALFIFRTVLGRTWPITGHASEPLPGDEEQVPLEAKYMDEVRSMLAGVGSGDIDAAAARLHARWPEYYNSEIFTGRPSSAER